MAFPGSCLVKGHVMFGWSGPLRGQAMFGKGISITQHSSLGSLCFALVALADGSVALVRLAPIHPLSWLHREKRTKAPLVILLLLVDRTAAPDAWTEFCEWIKMPLLIHGNWTADILTTKIGISPKNCLTTGRVSLAIRPRRGEAFPVKEEHGRDQRHLVLSNVGQLILLVSCLCIVQAGP